MCKHTQKPNPSQKGPISNRIYSAKQPVTQQITHKTTRLKSFFSLVDPNRETIATDLSIEQAKPISERIVGSLIKFQRMEGAS